MPIRRAFLITVLVTAVCPAFASKPPEWVEVDSPHFSVMTDAGEKRGRDVALRFEQMRAVFGAYILHDKVNIGTPLQIIAFRNNKELMQFSNLWNGKPVELAGFFQRGDDRNFVALDLSAEDHWSAVFHEYAHVLLDSNFGEMPAWFDEGIAEYYSTIAIQGNDVSIGQAPESARMLFQFSLLPVVDLFSVQHNSTVYNKSGDARSLFYAQSWLLVHYLFDKQKLKDTSIYVTLNIDQHVPVPEAIRRAYGIEPKALDRQIQDYLHGNRLSVYKMKTPPEAKDFTYTAKQLDSTQAAIVLADLHLHTTDRFEQGMRDFEEILKSHPDEAAAHRGLGYGYLRKSDLDKAAEHFQRAAELNSTDPRVFFYSAMLLMRRGTFDPEEVKRVRSLAERAVALDPNYPEAHSMLSEAAFMQSDANVALSAAQKAVSLKPREDEYQEDLARAYILQKNFNAAIAILEKLRAGTNPAIAANAAQNLDLLRRFKDLPAEQVSVTPYGLGFQIRGGWSVEPNANTAAIRNTAPPTESGPPQLRRVAPVHFARGKLVNTDCSSTPSAVLNITLLDGTVRKIRVPDRKKIVLIGADDFSCDWTNKRVLLNYRDRGNGDTELISLEVVQ